jgi:hypothetical protein
MTDVMVDHPSQSHGATAASRPSNRVGSFSTPVIDFGGQEVPAAPWPGGLLHTGSPPRDPTHGPSPLPTLSFLLIHFPKTNSYYRFTQSKKSFPAAGQVHCRVGPRNPVVNYR